MYLRKIGTVSTRVMPLLMMSCRCSLGAEEGEGHCRGMDMCKVNEACAYDLCWNSGEVGVARALWWMWPKVSLRSVRVRWR